MNIFQVILKSSRTLSRKILRIVSQGAINIRNGKILACKLCNFVFEMKK